MRDSTGWKRGVRSNALWGSGSRGESRKNALWGSGGRDGRRFAMAALVALTLVVPLSAGADNGGGKGKGNGTYISPGLLENSDKKPNQKLHVIIQSSAGTSDAAASVNGLGADIRRRLQSADAVAVDITAGKLASLAKKPGLTITPDSTVELTGTQSSTQLWPYTSGTAWLWGSTLNPAPQAPTIAVVDSGIDANRPDFDGGSRVAAQVNLSSMTPNSPGDGRGHGTFVAGIAAGSAAGMAGAAPNAKIVSLDVMNDAGTARTSDVIAACDWILANKATYNIRVANFSLHSGTKNDFYNDPLDRAVEKLWFNNVFVVAAAGNYGSASGPSGVMYAPGNDPFVMTVGAMDLGSSIYPGDDTAAPWSAWGYTEDGFSKPEIGAAGRYMVGPVPTASTLVSEKPDHVVAPGYMELSGTSFAAPVVAGAAAQILARHPGWTPDQVKGALMLTARSLPSAIPGSLGVGGVNAYRAAMLNSAPNPNLALRKFVTSDLRFDAASWLSTVQASASWADASWADASWADASWSAASWADASWADASWADASWADASWADASWADASWADTSQADGADGDGSGSQPAATSAAVQSLQP
ncbi:MAG TPA: S8 family serine peptidase [Gaiellaceae bacterium]|nr:S8 family serine peptidase [Gaiellaceae bacterium]